MKNLLKAIADFQFECPAIKKEKNNDFGKFKYTDLSDVLQVIKPLLQKHGLGFYQITESDTIDELVTVLFHVESGETLESRLKMDLNVELRGMNKYQVMGSAISYSRKYALTAILGIVSDERSIDELKPSNWLFKSLNCSTFTVESIFSAIKLLIFSTTCSGVMLFSMIFFLFLSL